MDPVAVRMTGISKSFSGTRVLHGVDFDLRKGEVHALVGGNGAGKSTLMKILQGVYTPDEGQIAVDGAPVEIRSPHDARALGIGMIFQEFSLIPTLTVAQNIFLGHEPRGSGGLIDDRASVRRTRELFAEMEEDIDPNARMLDLGTGYWQLTEIAKALAQDARVLIMDEPTSSLTATEAHSLFALVQRLKERGISIIYISHRMDEIFRITDRITVLRDGRHILTEDTASLTMNQVIDAIVGQAMEQAFEWRERFVDRSVAPLLQVRNLCAGNRVQDVSFDLYPGEILGLAGLMGSGRTELARAIFGIDRVDRGEVLIRGRRVDIGNPEEAISAGVSLVPEDRRIQGLVLDHSVKNNLLLPLLDRLDHAGIIDDRRGDRMAGSIVGDLRIKTSSIATPVRLLSGGNQQKVVIGKWLATEPDILIMDEPTAGVDIQAKTEILGVIRALADRGKGIIVISSELVELLAVSDRLLVLRDGHVIREIDRREVRTEEELHRAVQGA
ncbi:MAG: monosaccharide transporter ATP-binding protein family [Thermomicrobiales bacterium]|nr:monosaccharide transporter ATP-binding protein family [Thermomicrobiales bacterium]MCD6058777.1 monosaccharide transporter ATP-binding protein family [Thermomicrobiales bacterium]